MTPKQREFAQAYLETGSSSEAYRRAYKTGKMSDGAIRVEASRLLKHPKIALMLSEARERAVEQMSVTVQSLTEELEAARRLAMADEKGASAAVAAIMGKAKLHGLHVDRSENVNHTYVISDEPMSADEWAERYCTEH